MAGEADRVRRTKAGKNLEDAGMGEIDDDEPGATHDGVRQVCGVGDELDRHPGFPAGDLDARSIHEIRDESHHRRRSRL
jgi:hypothetical protein